MYLLPGGPSKTTAREKRLSSPRCTDTAKLHSFPNLQEQQLPTYLLKFYCLNLPVPLPHLYPLLFYPFQTQRFYNILLISHMLSIFWIVGKKCLYLLLLTMLILGCFLPPLQSRLKEYLLSPLKSLREKKTQPNHTIHGSQNNLLVFHVLPLIRTQESAPWLHHYHWDVYVSEQD